MKIYVILKRTQQEYAEDEKQILYCGEDKNDAMKAYLHIVPAIRMRGSISRECQIWENGSLTDDNPRDFPP